MINPSVINPTTLPSVALEDKRLLPEVSGIYFVLADKEVCYIGKSGNIGGRWLKHHRKQDLKQESAVRIAYMQCPIELIDEVEVALIKLFRPRLNGRQALNTPFSASALRSPPYTYGEIKKQKQFMLTPTASDYLDEIAKELEATRSDALEQIIRFVYAERSDLVEQVVEFGATEAETEE